MRGINVGHVFMGVLIGAAGVWVYYNLWPSSLGGQKGA